MLRDRDRRAARACCAAAPIPTSSPSPITSSTTACPTGACSTTASAGWEAAACSSCPTPAAPSAGTGRRATGRRCRRRGPSSPRGCATSWRRPCRTRCRPAQPQRPAAQRRTWTPRSSPRSRPRAPPACRRSRPLRRARVRRDGVGAQGGGRHGHRAHHGPHRTSASRWMPPRRTCAHGSCRCPTPGILIEAPLIAAAARLGAGVVLDGQGGDELFGAAHFLIADRVRRLRPLSAWRLSRRHPWLGDDPPLRHVRRVFTSVGVRGALAPRLHEQVRRRRPAARYTPAWLRRGPAELYRDSQDPWRWKLLDGPRWWAYPGRHADARARDRRPCGLPAPARRHGGGPGALAAAAIWGSSNSRCAYRPRRTSTRSPRGRSCARRCAARCPPTSSRGATSATSPALHHRVLASPSNLERVRRLLDERRAAVGAYVDLRRLHRDHLDRPPAVGDPGWRPWAVHVWNVVTAEQWLRARVTQPSNAPLRDRGAALGSRASDSAGVIEHGRCEPSRAQAVRSAVSS